MYDTIDEYALIAETRFLEYKQKISPSYRIPPSYSADFKKLAEYCVEKGIDPVVFVDAQFDKIPAHEMTAKRLMYAGSEANFKNYVEKNCASIEEDYKIQLSYLERLVLIKGKSVKQVLLNDNLDFEPWFRILQPVQEIPEITKTFLAEARKKWTPTVEAFVKSKPELACNIERIVGKEHGRPK